MCQEKPSDPAFLWSPHQPQMVRLSSLGKDFGYGTGTETRGPCTNAILSCQHAPVPVLSWLPACGARFGPTTSQSLGKFDVCLLMWLLPTVARPLVIPAVPHLPMSEAVSV